MEPIHTEPTGSPLVGVPVAPGLSAGELLAELLRRSARGDQQAFAELYDATSSRVYGLAVRVVRDPAQAEEVTQEAFLEGVAHREQVRLRAGQCPLVVDDHLSPQVGRPGSVG